MRLLQKIFFSILCGGYFLLSAYQSSAFLGEDLWIELYRQIDENIWSLERKQYEYELTWQWETDISEVVNPILAEDGIECDISSSEDIDRLIWYGMWQDHLAFVLERCWSWEETNPTALVEQVVSSLSQVRDTFSRRAIDKTRRTYDIARIGLYSDGVLENSPFDLIYDLQEIDYIIFWEELEYNGVPYESSADDALEEHLSGSGSEDDDEDEEDEETGTGTTEDPETWTGDTDDPETPITEDPPWEHRYFCAADDDSSGLDDEDLLDILEELDDDYSGTWTYTPQPSYWVYPGWEVTNNASWWWPFPSSSPEWVYSWTTDSWECSEFFCIIIEFQKSNYGLAGWETRSIQKVMSKIAEHLEKPANASLTQHKMTTNNFELWAVIDNLPGMLRGLSIEVQSKPIPILEDVEWEESDAIEGDIFEMENLLRAYYRNNGLDYDRRNDLDIFWKEAEEAKVFETARGMPTTYPESRVNELVNFQRALAENNRVLSQAVDRSISQNELEDFANQFTELEKFVAAMKDFAESITGIVWEMQEIPTRSS